jgi:hypothetical protein
LASFLLLVSGLIYFKKTEAYFADLGWLIWVNMLFSFLFIRFAVLPWRFNATKNLTFQ